MINYWRTIDKTLIIFHIFLFAISIMLISSVGTFVAKKIGIENHNYFIHHQLAHISIAILTIIVFTLLPTRYIKYIGIFGTIVCILLIALLLYSDISIRGAKRWISILGFSVQPSEFLKPFFSVFVAAFLAKDIKTLGWVLFSYIVITTMVLMEPDFGTFLIISIVFLGQLILSNVSFIYICIISVAVLCASSTSYVIFPHIRIRVQQFLLPESEGNFQVKKSIDALISGGFFGVGPGEGKIKTVLPDAHTDFIFAVAVEEFGFLLGAIIIVMYFLIIMRITVKILNTQDNFTKICVMGIAIQIFAQTIINLGVNLNLLPTKGMTLPFISYGGSSMLATALGIGIILNLERTNIAKKYGLKSK